MLFTLRSRRKGFRENVIIPRLTLFQRCVVRRSVRTAKQYLLMKLASSATRIRRQANTIKELGDQTKIGGNSFWIKYSWKKKTIKKRVELLVVISSQFRDRIRKVSWLRHRRAFFPPASNWKFVWQSRERKNSQNFRENYLPTVPLYSRVINPGVSFEPEQKKKEKRGCCLAIRI